MFAVGSVCKKIEGNVKSKPGDASAVCMFARILYGRHKLGPLRVDGLKYCPRERIVRDGSVCPVPLPLSATRCFPMGPYLPSVCAPATIETTNPDNPDGDTNDQKEDAHEFLRHLLDKMVDCYLKRKGVKPSAPNRLAETTPINRIFGGYLRSRVRATRLDVYHGR